MAHAITKGLQYRALLQAPSRKITPQAFAQNVAHQLTGRGTGVGAALAATLAECVCIIGRAEVGEATNNTLTGVSIGHIDLGTLSDVESFDRAFTLPLKQLREAHSL